MQFARTTFAVDGFTGLLSQQAIVTVRYTQDDLNSAGGDAGKLALARWDQPPGSWTVLPTNVDRSRQVLTTSTNRFSTWSVVVTEIVPSGSGVKSEAKTTYASMSSITVIIGIIAAVSIIAIRRRNQ
jgi:hypothetical protein